MVLDCRLACRRQCCKLVTGACRGNCCDVDGNLKIGYQNPGVQSCIVCKSVRVFDLDKLPFGWKEPKTKNSRCPQEADRNFTLVSSTFLVASAAASRYVTGISAAAVQRIFPKISILMRHISPRAVTTLARLGRQGAAVGQSELMPRQNDIFPSATTCQGLAVLAHRHGVDHMNR